MGEKDFFDSETILTAHIYNENLKIPIVGPKIKVVESIWCDLSKLVREGQKANEKRFSSIGLTSFEKKSKNYPKMKLSTWVLKGSVIEKKHPSFLLMPNFHKLQEDSKNVSPKIGS